MASKLNHPLLQNLPRPHGFEPLRVEGTLPEGLRGTLYRAGPGIFERFGTKVNHPFEADGAITAVHFGGERPLGASRVVESAGYREEGAAGRFLYNSSARFLDRMKAVSKGRSKTTGNTSTFLWQDRLFALMEGGLPQEMDLETLDTLEATDLGVIPTSFSAHPHRVASLQTTFNFGLRYGRKMEIDLFALPGHGAARKLGTLTAPWQSMVHDFIATDRHLLILLGPIELILWRAVLGAGDFTRLFRWRPELGTRLFVVPIDDVDAARTYELEPFWAWHIANAFEDGGGPSIDLCRQSRITIDDFDLLQGSEGTPTLTRLHLDLSTGKVEQTRLFDLACDMPQIHPMVAGARHEIVFAQIEKADGSEVERGVSRFSLRDQRSTQWIAPRGHIPGEPVLVPRSQVEDDGWILNLVYDPANDTSYLAVLDGQHLEDGPVARVHFDQRIPLSFHGVFAGEG